jgi:hypothetical protein
LLIDFSSGSLIRGTTKDSKSYLTYLLPPIRTAREYFKNALRNGREIVSRKLYNDSGMKELIERFHASVREGSAPPIPYREILLTAKIMDEIFRQIGTEAVEPRERVESNILCNAL